MRLLESFKSILNPDLKRELLNKLQSYGVSEKRTDPSKFIKLKSGKISPYYINLREVILKNKSPLNTFLLREMEKMIDQTGDYNTFAYAGVGGGTLGSDLSNRFDINRLHDRGEVKEHGVSVSPIEGYKKNLGKVAVIDDIFSSGTSVGQTIDNLRAEGIEPEAIFVIVNRSEDPKIKEFKGIPIYSLFELEDFFPELKNGSF